MELLPSIDLVSRAMMDLPLLLPEIKSLSPYLLREGIVAAIALCPIDAMTRDSDLAVLECLRHNALRLKGINPPSSHPLRFLSTVNPLSQASLKHCMKCSHFKVVCPTLCVCRSLFNSVNRRVFCTLHSALSSKASQQHTH